MGVRSRLEVLYGERNDNLESLIEATGVVGPGEEDSGNVVTLSLRPLKGWHGTEERHICVTPNSKTRTHG